MRKKFDTVEVSFITLLQARLLLEGMPLANKIDEWVESRISSNNSKTLKKLISAIEKFDKSDHKKNVIEFELDFLDRKLILFFLSNIKQLDHGLNSSSRSVKIFSKNSFVDAGYLEITPKSIDYFDVIKERNKNNSVFLEYKPFFKPNFIDKMGKLKTAVQSIKTLQDDYPKILLSSDFGFAFDSRNKIYSYLIDPISKRSTLFESLNVDYHNHTEFTLRPKSAEAILQLSAAFENSQWLIINFFNTNTFLLFKIPELSKSNISYKLWSNHQISTEPYFKFDERINYSKTDCVSLDINLSIECSKIFNWFLPNNFKDIVRCSSLLTH